MDWQQIAALGLVATVTTLWLLSRARARKRGGCSGGCCGSALKGAAAIPDPNRRSAVDLGRH